MTLFVDSGRPPPLSTCRRDTNMSPKQSSLSSKKMKPGQLMLALFCLFVFCFQTIVLRTTFRPFLERMNHLELSSWSVPVPSHEPSYRTLLDPIEFPSVDYDEKHRVALCTSINSEHRYVSEWLDYHLALGFSDIYISDNSPQSTLSSWNGTRSNRVHVYSTPNHTATMLRNLTTEAERKHPHWHMNQNGDCGAMLKQQANPPYWVAFFDVDEFMVLYNQPCGAAPEDCQHPNPSVVDFLEEHVPDGAMQINWIMFGTGQHAKFLDFPVLQRFQYRVPGFNKATKMVIRLQDLEKMMIHTGRTTRREKYGRRHFGSGKIEHLCCVENVTEAPVALHHYYTKSLEEIQSRFLCKTPTDCQSLQDRSIFEGSQRDDTAWNTLTRLLPQYKVLEDAYNKALQGTYQNQTEEYKQTLADLTNRPRPSALLRRSVRSSFRLSMLHK